MPENKDIGEIIYKIQKNKYIDSEKAAYYSNLLKKYAMTDPYAEAYMYYNRCNESFQIGKNEEAIEYAMKALNIAVQNNFVDLVPRMYNFIGLCYANVLDMQMALEYYFKGLNSALENNNRYIEIVTYNNIGDLYGRLGDYKTAITYYERYDDAEDMRNEQELTYANCIRYANIAEAYLNLKDYEKAEYYSDKCLEMSGDIDYNDVVTLIYKIKAFISYYRNDEDASCEYIDKMMAIVYESVNKADAVSFVIEVTRLVIRMGRLDKARELLEHMYSMTKELDNITYEVKSYEVIVEYLIKIGDKERLMSAYVKYYNAQSKYIEYNRNLKISSLKSRIELEVERQKQSHFSETNKILSRESEIDSLTKIYNRYGMARYIDKNIKKAIKKKQKFAIIIADIDYFKQLNDTYGHIKGDECIKKVAKCLAKYSDRGYYTVRYGGDEFFMLCRNRKDADVEKDIENMLKDIKNLHMENKNSQVSKYVSVTIGAVNIIPENETQLNTYIKMADDALYDAKMNGRNKAIFRRE